VFFPLTAEMLISTQKQSIFRNQREDAEQFRTSGFQFRFLNLTILNILKTRLNSCILKTRREIFAIQLGQAEFLVTRTFLGDGYAAE
jgi:hypothetical protein